MAKCYNCRKEMFNWYIEKGWKLSEISPGRHEWICTDCYENPLVGLLKQVEREGNNENALHKLPEGID